MALSGVTDGAVNVADVISEAMSVAGIKYGGDTIAAEDQAVCLSALRLMLRTWAASGQRLWLNQTQDVTLVSGTATYALSPRSLEVLHVYRRANGNDVPVRVVSREEFERLPNKTTSGAPFMVWADRSATATTLNVYPVPGANEVAASMILRVAAKRQLQDVTAAGETLDWPPEWIEAMVYNLAVRISPRFDLPVKPELAILAGDMYANLNGQDREGSVIMRAGPRR